MTLSEMLKTLGRLPGEILFYILVIVFASILIGSISSRFISEFSIEDTSRQRETYTNEFCNYLLKSIDSDIFDEEYCKTAFSHFDRKYNGRLSKYGYTELIEDFVVFISNKYDTTSGIDTLKYNKAKLILKKAKETEPFSSLPSEERRLMDNIKLFIQKEDLENSTNALNELKQVILARHREYVKIEKQNSWSIPLAFIGMGFTLLFGIISTVRLFRKRD